MIGDPELTGWLTVLSYLVCFALSFTVTMRLRGQKGRGLWLMITVLMLLLAINKQLDLQTALTATGRCLSHVQGWYEDRQTVQKLFIGAMIVIISTVIALMLASMRGKVRENALAFMGLFVLMTFVMVRAVGFHHMDSLISAEIASVSVNFIFENAGLLMIALNALALLRVTLPKRGGQPA
ncbi:hypothetical protein [Paracoccus sp. (in: a-proteobacteria)]|uniref:hypothetical protein n=1 Tax=Paracoccus sp. TaxID=267 RepID=UPI0028A1F078|nr:hypothetical protein [Paracoccus sp. (in: a-proteobacteria)]